jgi:putative membrane protein
MIPRSIRPFFYGLCMGTADVIPGISGGTVAFIIGFYGQLIASVKSPLKNWKFLLPLVCGMGTAIMLLAELIHTILQSPAQRICFYGLFFGLILVSIYFCLQRIQKWSPSCLILGALMSIPAFFLTVGLQAQPDQTLSTGWLVFTGFMAIGAMLLPGISGSYIMVIFGVYPSVVASLAEIGRNGPSLEPITLLASVGLGIVLGAISFTRGIELLLLHYHDLTMAGLVGFMLGALPAVWPFWETSLGANGMIHLESAHLPGFDLVSIASLCFMGLGFYTVLFLEKLKKVEG